MNPPRELLNTLLVNSVGVAATIAFTSPTLAATVDSQVQPSRAQSSRSLQSQSQRSQLPQSQPQSSKVNSLKQNSLEQIADYAKGKVPSANPALNQIDGYVNEGSQDAAIDLWQRRAQQGDFRLYQIDRYANEGFEAQALDIATNRIVPLTQLSDRQTLDWTFPTSDPEVNPATVSIAQVTSVAQLTDVSPTDWAFAALQNLVEKYGVILGYPENLSGTLRERTFRGDRVLTRYEFAAALNTLMEQVVNIAGVTVNPIDKPFSKEDLATLEKLQTEYATELASIKSRVDGLEPRTAKLETDRFSFTSKLFGLGFFNVTGLTGGQGVLRETGFRGVPANQGIAANPLTQRVAKNPNVTSSGLVWLNLGSSFTGKDLLITQLAAGQGISPANVITSATSTINSTGIPFTDAGAFLGPNAPVVLRELAYEFPVGKGRLAIGPRINWFRFFDANPYTFFLTGTASLNGIANTLTSDVRRGAGAIYTLPLSNQFDVRVGYLGEGNEYNTDNFLPSNSASNLLEGLFGGTNSLTAELTYKPSPTVNLRFLFNRSNSEARTQFLDNQVPVFSPIRLVSGTPINGLADDGFGGDLRNAQSNIFELNVDWLVGQRVGFFGRYGIANTNLNARNGSNGRITTQTFQVGFTVLDLFRKGAQGTVSFVMPFNYTDGRRFLVSGAGDGGVQYELEGVYFFPLTRNIAIVPTFQLIWNINNFNSNSTVGIFNLRTQFSF
jgi:hypothetical protein